MAKKGLPSFGPTKPKVTTNSAAAALVFIIMHFVGDYMDPDLQVAVGTLAVYLVALGTGWLKKDTLLPEDDAS